MIQVTSFIHGHSFLIKTCAKVTVVMWRVITLITLIDLMIVSTTLCSITLVSSHITVTNLRLTRCNYHLHYYTCRVDQYYPIVTSPETTISRMNIHIDDQVYKAFGTLGLINSCELHLTS